MWSLDLAQSILNIWDAICENILTILRTPVSSWAGGEAWDIAVRVHNAFIGVALGLAVLFFAISFFRYVDDVRELTFREVAGWILRFAVMYILISYSMEIMQFFINLSADATASLMAVARPQVTATAMSADLTASVEALNTALETGGWNILAVIGTFFETIGISMFFFVVMLVVFVSGIIMIVSVFVRFFKLFIYIAVAPIPLATLAGHRSSEIARHFLKSFAAICFEVVIICIAIAIFNAVAGASNSIFTFLTIPGDGEAENMWNAATNWGWTVLIGVVTLTVLVRQANRYVREMIGV